MAKPKIKVWGITTCDTVRKATAFLKANNIAFEFIDLKTTKPPKALLKNAMKSVDTPRKLFNTSGGAYKDGGFRDRAATMTPDDIINAMAAEPMLIKRPVVVTDKGIMVGFSEALLRSIL
jgi:arsenate reductase (glutaredoxin)